MGISIPAAAFDHLETETEETTCARCGAKFHGTCLRNSGRQLLRQRHCGPCSEVLAAEQSKQAADERREARRQQWETRLAALPKYREAFDSEKAISGSLELWERGRLATTGEKPTAEARDQEAKILTRRLSAAMAKVEAWQRSSRGIGLVGESGRAKTRLMFTLLGRLFVSGMSVEFISATEFSDEVGARFGQDSQDAKRWIDRLSKVDVFFYDDLGKEALTERVAKELFNLFDKRTNGRKPIFTTANFTGQQLEAHFDAKAQKAGAPIINRLRDCCDFLPL